MHILRRGGNRRQGQKEDALRNGEEKNVWDAIDMINQVARYYKPASSLAAFETKYAMPILSSR
jgi:hypothetical protein